MSAFNVGKKVSAAVRILQRKRDASARATHLVGKKYPLITYEKALLSQATGGKFPSVTFIERKIMSTKTSIKRIALVAAAALTLGGFTAVSAHAGGTATVAAAAGQIVSGSAGAGDTTTSRSVSAIADGSHYLSVVFTAGSQDFAYAGSTTGVGTIVGAPQASNATSTQNPNVLYSTGGTSFNWYKGANPGDSTLGFAGTETLTVAVVSSVAGTQTLTITGNNAASTAVKLTINWVAATSVAMDATQSVFYAVNGATATSSCFPAGGALGTNHSADLVNQAATAIGSIDVGTAPKLCWSIRDGNGLLVSPTAVSVIGSLGGSSTANTASQDIDDPGVALSKGTATYTMIATKGATVLSMTTTVKITGNFATLALGNVTYSARYKGLAMAKTDLFSSISDGTASADGTTSAEVGNSASKNGILSITAKDSNGNIMDIVNGGATALTSFHWTVSSSKVATAASLGGNNSFGSSVTTSTALSPATDLKSTHFGSNSAQVTCGSVSAEKLTITLSATTSLGAVVTTAPVTFYCADKPAKVAVNPASSSVDAGAVTTVAALVTDADGFPAADGTSVTFAATGQGVVAPSTSTTSNGIAGTSDTTVVNFIAAGDGGSATVTAIAGNLSGSSSISIAGGSGSSSLSLDAANAATDAANNAYDEAQNATQAASDALAAVTALSAQVGALIATVKSLAAVVAKIKAKVKA